MHVHSSWYRIASSYRLMPGMMLTMAIPVMEILGVRNLRAQGRCRGLKLESCTVAFLGWHFIFTFAVGCNT